ncbi:MAG: VCBS repeat-containing protein, partial [Acidobacteriota bacterium]|nr:VCBS repeat-containing protein [Acidobacteriota bacterium]
NPFAGTSNGDRKELSMSREYLYTESGMFAVEDAGATSAPTADLAIWRPSTGQWWTMGGTGTRQVTVSWGMSGDIPAIGDYDGDGKTDFCVFRPQEGLWYLINSASGDSSTSVISFGGDGDVPAQADFDGDGKTDIAVFRPANGHWFVRRSSDQGITQLPLGSLNDSPSPKDFDGDGKADIAVWRSENGVFYSLNSSDGEIQFTNMGTSGEAVPADYDGDGRDDFAVRNGTQWKVLRSASGSFTESSFQAAGDVAVQNDYDGDGKVDIAVWRPSEGRWFISQSSNGEMRTALWGGAGDIPLPALYRR